MSDEAFKRRFTTIYLPELADEQLLIKEKFEEGRSLKGLVAEYGVLKQVYPTGQNSSAKNAKQTKKPKPIMIL